VPGGGPVRTTADPLNQRRLEAAENRADRRWGRAGQLSDLCVVMRPPPALLAEMIAFASASFARTYNADASSSVWRC
jgi:hypothetical protein